MATKELCPANETTGRHDCHTPKYWDVAGNEAVGSPGAFGHTKPYSSTAQCARCGADLITYNERWPHGIKWNNRTPNGWTLMTTPEQINAPVFLVDEDPY